MYVSVPLPPLAAGRFTLSAVWTCASAGHETLARLPNVGTVSARTSMTTGRPVQALVPGGPARLFAASVAVNV